MIHQKWLEVVQNALMEIEKDYPTCKEQDRPKMRKRFQNIKESCDQLLESWAEVEERIAVLLDQYPELGETSSPEELEEEVWLHETSVRQFREGQGYYGLTMYQKSEELFQQVVEMEPDFLLGRIYLALCQFLEGKYFEALKHFRIVMASSTHEAFTCFANHMIGCIQVKLGNDEQAIKEFSKVVSLDPECSDAWFNLGACYYRLGSFYEAIPYFYHAINISEDDWEAMYYLAECYGKYQEWESARFWRLTCLEKIHHPKVIESLAHDHEQMNQSEQALVWYRRLFSFPAYEISAIQGIAWNMWKLGKKREAYAWLKKGLSRHANDPDLLFLYGWFLWADGMHQRLEQLMKSLPDQWRKMAIWSVLESRVAFAKGNYEEALAILDQILDKDDHTKSLGLFHKGRLLLELGRVAEAVSYLRQAQEIGGKWEEPSIYLGISEMLEGRKV